MPRQSDDSNVVAEVLAPELSPDAELLRHVQDVGFHGEVAVAVSGVGSVDGQIVEVVRAGQLGCFERVLGTGAADHDCQVVRRAGCGTDHAEFLVEKGREDLRFQERGRFLKQEALVGAATALGDEQELVGVLVPGVRVSVNLDLRGKVATGVALFPHAQR